MKDSERIAYAPFGLLWSRFKRASRRAWTWCWSREWFAMVFFLVVMVAVIGGLL